MQSRFALGRLLAFIVMLSLLLAAPSQAQWQRGGLSRTFNTYSPPPQPRYTPPRPMMPQQVITPRTPQFTAATRGATMAPGSTTGIRMARPLPLPPSIRQNSAIAQMPSYTKRVTITGAPIVVSRTKVAYSVPQQGIFSTRVVTTYRPIRVALIQRYGSSKVVVLQQRLVRIATSTKIFVLKQSTTGGNRGNGGGSGNAPHASNDNSQYQAKAQALAKFGRTQSELVLAAASVKKSNGLTQAGHALTKHAANQRESGTFPRLSGSPREINERAGKIVEEILNNPESKFRLLSKGALEVREPEGRGIRFDRDGDVGFVD